MSLIQFKLPKNDSVINQIINEIENEGKGQRGYLAEQIRERLKFVHMLQNMFGEKDLSVLQTKIIQGYYSGMQPQTKIEHVKTEEPIQKKVEDAESKLRKNKKTLMSNIRK